MWGQGTLSEALAHEIGCEVWRGAVFEATPTGEAKTFPV